MERMNSNEMDIYSERTIDFWPSKSRAMDGIG
jgi:hypothetical protein